MRAKSLQQKFIQIRSNKAFELFVIGVILLSAVLVGAKTFEQPPAVTALLKAMDWFITIFFLTEITIRFLAEEKKSQFFKNFWNVFDTLIVTVSLIPIDNSESAVIARLVRVFRVLRMISIIPELRILLVSLVKALPQLGYVMLLMFIIFYIYAAVGATFFYNINEDLWGDIALALLTLFRVMTFEDWTDVMYETMEVYPLSWLYYLTFIFLSAFAFLNMVIGIVVNVMEQEHAKAREEKLQEQNAQEPSMRDMMSQLTQIQTQLNSLTSQQNRDRQ